MPSAMVTFNGRITLPTDIRKKLGLKTGDNVDFIEIEKGRFAICTRNAVIRDKGKGISTPSFMPAAGAVEEAVS